MVWGKSMMPAPHLPCSGPRINLRKTFFSLPLSLCAVWSWTGFETGQGTGRHWEMGHRASQMRRGEHGEGTGALGFTETSRALAK